MSSPVPTIKIGSDICSVERIMLAYQKYGERFLDRVLIESEKAYVFSKLPYKPSMRLHRLAEAVAARFAAKEAIAKALGSGWRTLHWREVEIANAENGAPYAILHGLAKDLLGSSRIEISLSHERNYALAMAIVYSLT